MMLDSCSLINEQESNCIMDYLSAGENRYSENIELTKRTLYLEVIFICLVFIFIELRGLNNTFYRVHSFFMIL